MKLLRWAAAGASVYVIYKYSIGKKAVGEDVFVSPEREIAKLSDGDAPRKPPRRALAKPRGKAHPGRGIT